MPRTIFANDDVTISAGETREWVEYWLPFAATGGLSTASRDAVLFVASKEGNASVHVYSAVSRQGSVVLLQAGKTVSTWSVKLTPGTTFDATVPIGPGNLKLQLLDEKGLVVSETMN